MDGGKGGGGGGGGGVGKKFHFSVSLRGHGEHVGKRDAAIFRRKPNFLTPESRSRRSFASSPLFSVHVEHMFIRPGVEVEQEEEERRTLLTGVDSAARSI